VAAYGGDYRYELYTGAEGAEERARFANYQAGETFSKLAFGWNSHLCQVEMQYICKLPATTFPCNASSSASPSPVAQAVPASSASAASSSSSREPPSGAQGPEEHLAEMLLATVHSSG
jgi:hypothetical protein